MGIGDWGLGIGDWGLGPIPNPQSPIPNPHKKIIINYKNLKFIIDDYNFYNLNEVVLNELLNKWPSRYKSFLQENIKFTEHLNRMKKMIYLSK